MQELYSLDTNMVEQVSLMYSLLLDATGRYVWTAWLSSLYHYTYLLFNNNENIKNKLKVHWLIDKIVLHHYDKHLVLSFCYKIYI